MQRPRRRNTPAAHHAQRVCCARPGTRACLCAAFSIADSPRTPRTHRMRTRGAPPGCRQAPPEDRVDEPAARLRAPGAAFPACPTWKSSRVQPRPGAVSFIYPGAGLLCTWEWSDFDCERRSIRLKEEEALLLFTTRGLIAGLRPHAWRCARGEALRMHAVWQCAWK